MKLLYHVIAHLYHSHFKEIVLLELHPHLNCIFAHLVLFNEQFKLIEDKELEVLHDLAVALKLYPPNTDFELTQDESNDVSSSSSDNNNNTSSYSKVITTQCRSISALANYKHCDDMKENNCLLDNVASPMLVDDNYVENKPNSPEPMQVEPMASSENIPKKFVINNFDLNLRFRSTSANAVLCKSNSNDIVHGSSPVARRCNSDRTASTSTNVSILCNTADQNASPFYQSNYSSGTACRQ